MKKFLLSVIIFSFIFVAGCKKENNPVEPIENSSVNYVWYGGNNYSADSLKSWGMGNSEKEYMHCEKDYEWYVDQATTGVAAGNNCGPSCVTMAIKWYDKNFSKTAEEARNMYPLNNDWWYTNNIIDYLNYYSVPNITVKYTDVSQLENIFKGGNIAILCISTEFLRYNTNKSHRVDKFYNLSTGHFIVAKGIRKVDGETYIEVYDPNSWNSKYSDGSLKGKNRHYRSADISNAVKNWWGYFIVITKNNLSKVLNVEAENPANIKHMWGK